VNRNDSSNGYSRELISIQIDSRNGYSRGADISTLHLACIAGVIEPSEILFLSFALASCSLRGSEKNNWLGSIMPVMQATLDFPSIWTYFPLLSVLCALKGFKLWPLQTFLLDFSQVIAKSLSLP